MVRFNDGAVATAAATATAAGAALAVSSNSNACQCASRPTTSPVRTTAFAASPAVGKSRSAGYRHQQHRHAVEQSVFTRLKNIMSVTRHCSPNVSQLFRSCVCRSEEHTYELTQLRRISYAAI